MNIDNSFKMTNLSKTILLADDHSVVRQGISMILKESYKDLTILHAADFETALTQLRNNAVYLLVLDISIPEGKGVQMIELVKAINPEIKILVFSAYEEELYAMRYLKAGAEGYLNKLSSETEFKKAFKSMLEDGTYMSEAIKQKIINATLKKESDNPLDILSNREIEIARLLVKGEGNLEIANKLNLQTSTVSTYKNRIFEKLAISNTVALVSLLQAYDDSFSV
ncbi:response regulator transcription factor [Flavobacterium antarcticum]|uniref:response regulator n=1 Tax=Flavobacterium antarcticum TaxID=271155 RepID=UPI0003B644A8|nr:response regulator transcription factor [Flavobacterium antarcticum]